MRTVRKCSVRSIDMSFFQHQHERSGHLPCGTYDTPQTPAINGASTRCTILHIRSRMRSRESHIPSVRWSLRITDRSMTGSSTRSVKIIPIGEMPPRQIEFAKLYLTNVVTGKRYIKKPGGGRHCGRMG